MSFRSAPTESETVSNVRIEVDTIARRVEAVEAFEGADLERVKRMLLEAYADEWIAGYHYMLTASLVQGPGSKVIAEEYMKEAAEEITKYAVMIMERLQQLGVEPPRDFTRLWDLSPCKYPALPEDPYDIDGFIIAAVKAELCAIEGYKRLYKAIHGVDPVTEELLADETRHKTELLGLLSREGLRRLEEELRK